MIKLFEEDKFELNRASSKGNQLKFQRDGIWYKADYLGYEGLAEYAVSKLLRFSDLEPSEYVDYELEQIEYNGNVYNGCKSADFTEGKSLITLERLFKRVYGEGLSRVIYRTENHTERLRILCEQVERVTGITGFGIYMSKLLTVDSLFLNILKNGDISGSIVSRSDRTHACGEGECSGSSDSDKSFNYSHNAPPLRETAYTLIFQ